MSAVMKEPGSSTNIINGAISGKPGGLSKLFELLNTKEYLQRVDAIIEKHREKYGNPIELEDLRQEVLALLLKLIKEGKVRTQPNKGSLFAFLSGLANNISRDALKRKKAQKRADHPVELPDDIKGAPSFEHCRQALSERLSECDSFLANRGIKQETRDLIWEYVRYKVAGFSDTDIRARCSLKKSHIDLIKRELEHLASFLGSNE